MKHKAPAKWFAVLILIGLISGCAGGFSKKQPPPSGKRVPQQETRLPKEQEETTEEVIPPDNETEPTAAAVKRGLNPTRVPTGSPYRPSDLSKLPTTVNRADRSAMVLIPKGSYLITDPNRSSGDGFGSKGSLYPVPMPAFYIDRYEITVDQFKHLMPEYDETVYTDGTACPRCPAMGITYWEARSYCARTGKRLPTETQWEAAGRGASNRPYPWGKRFESDRANLTGNEDGSLGAAEVGSYPSGASIFGAMDMIGNVWEWVDSGLTEPVPPPAPAGASDELSATHSVAPAATRPQQMGWVKGGGYRTAPKIAILSSRHRVPVDMRNPTFGFRCVKPHLGK